jgi:hypothetical protein
MTKQEEKAFLADQVRNALLTSWLPPEDVSVVALQTLKDYLEGWASDNHPDLDRMFDELDEVSIPLGK